MWILASFNHTCSALLRGARHYSFIGQRTFGAQNPGDTETRQPEPLGEPVNDQDIILIYVFHILGRGDSGAVAVTEIIVARIELITNEGSATTANVLNLRKLGVADDSSSRIPWVRGQNDRRASRNLLGNFDRVNVVSVIFGKGDRDGSKLGDRGRG